MIRSTWSEPIERGWDEPWYRVRMKGFEASFLPSEGEDLDEVCTLSIDRDGRRSPLRRGEPGQHLFRQRRSPWSLVLPVHPPPSARHRGNDLIGSLQVGEVLVVRHRTQGTLLGIDDQGRSGRLVPALHTHHAADLGVGAIEDRGPAGLIEIAKRHRAIISNHDVRASQVSILCTFIRTRLWS
ncbi:hypothetical protein [Streptomyces rubrogriseus]|uniref:hypothetical protein n=1 Tax=Streptomyces rubrogriseus TaxID=194673 RepID=UPI0037D4C770